MYLHRRQNLIGRAGGLGGGLRRGRRGALLGAALVAVAGFSSTVAAQELTTLYSFTGSDGAFPHAGLIADPAGNLYGTTNPITDAANCNRYAKNMGAIASAPCRMEREPI